MSDKRQTLRVEIAKLTLSPGDILVLKVDEYLSQEQVERLKVQMSAQLPSTIKTIILGKGLSLAVLTRAEIEQRAAA